MAQPLVSILVNNFNYGRFLADEEQRVSKILRDIGLV